LKPFTSSRRPVLSARGRSDRFTMLFSLGRTVCCTPPCPALAWARVEAVNLDAWRVLGAQFLEIAPAPVE
jgi:hypothetical protein